MAALPGSFPRKDRYSTHLHQETQPGQLWQEGSRPNPLLARPQSLLGLVYIW